MIVVGMISWWYTGGFIQAARSVGRRLASLFDFFSIDLLLRTLFSPFRQISAGRVNGPLNVQLQALFDRLLSRLIGAIVRTIVMLIGIVTLLFMVLAGAGYLLLWVLMPLLPVIGLTLTLAGWMPWSL